MIAGHPVALSPYPSPQHQRIAKRLLVLIDNQINKQKNCKCEVFHELDWWVSDVSVVRPDLMILCDYKDQDIIEDTPKLIIEVISPSTRDKDLNTKFNLYARMKVAYYLIVDPKHKTIEVYSLNKNDYLLVNIKGHKYHFNLDDQCRLEADFSNIFD